MSQPNPFLKLFRPQSTLVKLAVLQPGEEHAPINITLTEANAEEASYECLSYDRSKDNEKLNVLVDGQNQAVPSNLETGLRTFRRKDRPRILWADLLIGEDAKQRSQQASNLRAILSNAERTLCWTGSGNEKSPRAYSIIREMAKRWNQACVKVDMPASLTKATTQQMQSVMDQLRSCPASDLESFNLELWNEIYDVFGSPYWNSAQCVSEVVLAKNAMVVCGRSNIPWHDFHGASKALAIFQGAFFHVPLLPKVAKSITILHGIEVAERRSRTGETIELLPMIGTAREAHPKDPRECVFSMLPIVTPSARLDHHQVLKPQLPQIDYSKNVQEVFTEASKYIIQERQDLMLWWSERAPCAKRVKGLPSWAPDWSAGTGGSSALHPVNGLRRWWDSVEPKKPLRITDQNELRLQAYPLDKVVYVSPLFHAGNSRRLALTEWRKLEPVQMDSVATQGDKFWRTLLSNNAGFGTTFSTNGIPSDEVGLFFWSMLAEEQILEKLDCTMDQLSQPEVIARIDQTDPVLKDLFGQAGRGGHFEELMRKTSWGRRFFRTESGRYGMTGVEDYRLIDSMYTQNEVEPGDEAEREPGNMGAVLSDPLARSMLEAFQRHLQERDPTAAGHVSKMMRGEFPHQQNTSKTGGIEEGDILVACIGGFNPYVLRPKRNDSESDEATSSAQTDATYEFVGDCYLHGVMDGECFVQTDSEGQQIYLTDMSKVVDIMVV